MPNITYQHTLPDAVQFAALFETTGWNDEYHLSAADLHQALQHSWYAVSAYDGGQLVGFGRVISDGVLHALIVEMIVAPEYQARGIGRAILIDLVTRCREAGICDIQLFCAKGKVGFYAKQGFVARPDDAPGMQFKSQADNHDG
jgi:GNAT superfamily N-acetyltransferase